MNSGSFKKGHRVRLKHGHSSRSGFSSTYQKWSSMVARCSYKSVDSYHLYGGRGIKVCQRWRKFENFLADMGECPVGYSLDRIDSNKNYSPKNCRWADKKTQARNKRNNIKVKYGGRTHVLADLVEAYGVRSLKDTWTRINRDGWSLEDALFKEPKGRK